LYIKGVGAVRVRVDIKFKTDHFSATTSLNFASYITAERQSSRFMDSNIGRKVTSTHQFESLDNRRYTALIVWASLATLPMAPQQRYCRGTLLSSIFGFKT
jgi:hypothetical protein